MTGGEEKETGGQQVADEDSDEDDEDKDANDRKRRCLNNINGREPRHTRARGRERYTNICACD